MDQMAEAGILRETESELQLPSYTPGSHHFLFSRQRSLFATLLAISLCPSTRRLSDVSLHVLTSHKGTQSIRTSVSESHSLSNYISTHYPLTFTYMTHYHYHLLASQTQRFAFLLEHPKEAILTLTSSHEHDRLGFRVIWFSWEGMKGEYGS